MTTYRIYYPKWMGKIASIINTVGYWCMMVVLSPFVFMIWLSQLNIIFEEKQEPRP